MKCTHCGGTGEEPQLTLMAIEPALPAVRAKANGRKLRDASYAHAAQIIFTYWRDTMGKHPTRTIFDPKRKRCLLTRLRENEGDVTELLYAVDGALKDDRLMGRRADSDRKYDGIETIFRDRGQVERLTELVPKKAEQHPYLSVP